MNAVPTTDETPISALGGRCVHKAWKQCQGRGKPAAVRKHNDNAIIRHLYIDGGCIRLNGRMGIPGLEKRCAMLDH